MGKVIAICNQKGGVGKTTTTVSLGVELANKGNKVLVVDGDQQANLTYALGFKNPDALQETLGTLMNLDINNQEYNTQKAILATNESVDLLPSSVELAGIDIPLISAVQREYVIRRILAQVSDDYDYVLIDCPPSLGLMTMNILAASDSVLIPVNTGIFSTVGMNQLFETIGLIRKKLNTSLAVDGILFTMTDNRTNITKEIIKTVNDVYGSIVKVYKTIIPTSVKAIETVAAGKSVTTYEPNSKVGQSYKDFVNEFVG